MPARTRVHRLRSFIHTSNSSAGIADDGFDDRGVMRVVPQTVDEGPIDLQGGERLEQGDGADQVVLVAFDVVLRTPPDRLEAERIRLG